ncbi:MAG TPA: response regulator transcription factor [Chloroflexota bacterium]|jgi:DNA-binding NarL/FixJ family response regulator
MTEGLIRLQVVDDHWLVRLGLTSLFANLRHFAVVAEAETAAAAIATAREHRPDVVIMDVRLPDGSGVDACRQIRSDNPTTRVVMLTSFADEDAVVAAILAGASGYLLKQSEPERLIAAVETAAAGGSLLDPAVTDTVLRWMRGTASGGDASGRLSEQERKILPLIAEGKTNREIGAQLFLSEHTVKTYVSSLLKKLQLARRAEAAAYIARQQQARAS